MPIYEYQCEQCSEVTEAIQKFSDAPLSDCPTCGEPALKKLLSAPAFRLGGSGWYETDFKGGSKKNLASSDNHCPSKDTKSGCGGCAATSD
ncbi:FmdB family zinc ribbon protein [uncultured Endozoicomonas sp.]|uniref:FmdB family zinc ribbon protein n=1 Tax=uncultured Endozoicomonas sp. TaxID=432652 RepID=UPI002635E53D|nr:FmdB family zinc ribbon protein [uncultured Endozoicomonas sp.]